MLNSFFTLVSFLVLSCIATHAALENVRPETFTCDKSRWSMFKEQFNKNYINSTEDTKRFSIFCKKYTSILKHNANPNATYRMAVNHFTDMRSDEFNSNGFINDIFDESYNAGPTNLSHWLDMVSDPPEFVDWSNDPKIVSPARNQGYCGSCWAFATIGMLEGQQRPNGNEKLVELSEQNLLDCNQSGNCCQGGDFIPALKDIKKMGGLMSRSDYPYVSGWSFKRGSCTMDSSKIIPFTKKLGKIELLKFGDEQLLKKVVATYGPVAIGFHVQENFRSYSRGIYYDADCPKVPNHAMLLVGYGTDAQGQDYWKVKNSWGGSSWNPFNKWGKNGFGLIARNRKNACGMGYHSVIVRTD